MVEQRFPIEDLVDQRRPWLGMLEDEHLEARVERWPEEGARSTVHCGAIGGVP